MKNSSGLLHADTKKYYFQTSKHRSMPVVKHHQPITLLANDCFLSVARPRSPIFTEPDVPVIKILSHLRSRWMTAGERLCRNKRPFRICRHQFFSMLTLIFLNRRM